MSPNSISTRRASAEHTRRYRRRHRRGIQDIIVPLCDSDLNVLVRKGYLAPEERGRRRAIKQALETFYRTARTLISYLVVPRRTSTVARLAVVKYKIVSYEANCRETNPMSNSSDATRSSAARTRRLRARRRQGTRRVTVDVSHGDVDALMDAQTHWAIRAPSVMFRPP
jgi:hypothetical protein